MRVLVIEDEHKIAGALKKALVQEGYAVDVSYDGDDGYAMATTEPYDVAIIDRMIPGEYDGLAIVKAMREAKIHTPVLLLTALSNVRNPGRPISKEVIISHVWDYDSNILPNTVEVYVKYLRTKIDSPNKPDLIHTIRGFGYKIEAK